MNKSSLVDCIKCNNKVSMSADECPKCGEEDYKGEICFFCGNRLLKRKAVSHYGHYRNSTRLFYSHSACIEKNLFPPSKTPMVVNCNDCGANYTVNEFLNSFHSGTLFSPCNECGSRTPVKNYKCYFCGLNIYPDLHNYQTDHYNKLEEKTYIRYHKCCGPNKLDGYPYYLEKKKKSLRRKLVIGLIIVLVIIYFVNY